MKKCLALILILILLCMSFVVLADVGDIETAIYNESEIESLADENKQINELIPQFSFSELVNHLKSDTSILSPKPILHNILKILSEEILLNIHIMLTVIILAIILGIITNMQSSFNSKSVSETAFFAFFAVFFALLVKGMDECIEITHRVISDQVVFMQASVPVYTALLMSIGGISTAARMEPVFLFFIQLISSILEKYISPLIFWISILNMINCLSEKFSINRLIEFAKQLIKWCVGILMTLFIGILGMSGLTTSAIDGLGFRTLKYAVGSFVPVIGGLLSDSVSTVFASTIVIKNVIGTAGVITLILMCALPLIRMLAMILIYKLTTGLIEPVTDKRITAMVGEAGNTITFIFLILLTVTIMFILGVTIIIGIGNIAMSM